MSNTDNNKAIVRWLLLGVFMIMVQILIGGITRLTESGLSITEWKPITGVLPPLNNVQWQAEFDKYKQIDQFKYINRSFTLSDFKFIFFWEWMHRQWARLLGLVFLAGFIYFLAKRRFKKEMVAPMIILFLLGALQGLVGWIMVKSGLVPKKYYVGYVELTTHFISALVLLVYTLWFALQLSPSYKEKIISPKLRNQLWLIAIVLFVQLVYGGFMAGLKAAQSAPTWPDINGYFIPPTIGELIPAWENILNNNLTIHFIHRMNAYFLALIIIFFFISSRNVTNARFKKLRLGFLLVTLVQITLGIFTVLSGANPKALVFWGVSHQFIAMVMVIFLTSLFFLTRKKPGKQIT